MIQAAAPLKALIESGGFANWDLYTITLVGGGVLTYTTADFAITAPDNTIFDAPNVYGAGNVWFAGITWRPIPINTGGTQATAHWKLGLDTDRWTLQIAPRPFALSSGDPYPDKIGSVPWLQAAAAGVLADADVVVARAYFAGVPVRPFPPAGAAPVGTIVVFRGLIGEIDLTGASAVMTIADYRQALTQQMPCNLYQGSCRHRLFDPDCTLSPAGFTSTGTAAAGSTRGKIVASSSLSAPAGSATYSLGTLTMTSGANNGFRRFVTKWDGAATFLLLNPFPFAIAAGDTFAVTAGCNKSTTACAAFSNLVNFGGEPYIPSPEISYA